MRFKALTLFARAMREDQRSLAGAILQVSMAVATGLLLMMFVENAYIWDAPGRRMFTIVIWCNALALTLLGVSQFPAAISEEKEARTLGLLRMAGVGALSILIGKLANRLWLALSLLLIQMPFVMLCVSLGGIAVDQIIASYLSLMAFALMLAGLGMAVSVFAGTRTAACAGTFLLVLIVQAAVLPAQAYTYMSTGEQLSMAQIEAITSVAIWQQLIVIDQGGYLDYSIFDFFYLFNLAIGLLGGITAWLGFERFAKDSDGADGPRQGVLGFLHRLPLLRPERPWIGWPMFWKDYYFILGGKVGSVMRIFIWVGLLAIIGGIMQAFGEEVKIKDLATVGLGIGIWLIPLELAWNLARVFSQERTQATWPSLYALPRSMGRIVVDKVAVSVLALLPSLVVVITCFAIEDRIGRDFRRIVDEPMFWMFVAWIVTGEILVVWYSLLLPWGALVLGVLTAWFGGMMIIAMIAMVFMQHSPSEDGLAFFFGTICVGVSIACCFHCKRLLHRQASTIG